MDYFAAVVVGGFVLGGLAWVSTSLDGIAEQMRRANDLKEAELYPNGAPGKTPDHAPN